METNKPTSENSTTSNTGYVPPKTTETRTTYYDKPKGNKPPVLLLVLVAVLFVAAAVLGWLYYKQVQESNSAQQILETQKNELTNELNNMVVEYESLKTNNDTINHALEVQQDKIKRLLSLNASNSEKIRVYQKELTTLREVMKSYIVQIDSLNQRNLVLTAENLEVKTQLVAVETSRQELEVQRVELTGKVQKASVLAAKNVEALPMNKRSKERDKADKVEKIRICFTLRENAIVPAGTKDVYIRIIRPDDVVLTISEANTFFVNGDSFVYSAKRQVEYENKDVDMCIYWDNTGNLIAGSYSVDIYAEGNLIGTTVFVLK